MRIIQFGPYPVVNSIIRGGVESSVYGLANELAKTHQIFVFDFPRQGILDSVEEDDNLMVYRFTNFGLHQQDAARRIPELIALVERLNVDVCHIHGTGVLSSLLYRSLKAIGVPTLVTVHGLVYIEKLKSIKQSFSFKTLYQLFNQSMAERKLLNASERIIVDTKYVRDSILKYKLRHTPSMEIIPQGIANCFFNCSVDEKSRDILCVGSFSKRKGQLLLIKAFERCCQRNPSLSFTLTLCGSIGEEEYFTEVSRCVESSFYRGNITIRVNVPQDELLYYYQKAYIFALHSQEESQGIVLAEAMAVGLPVVSTRVGGIPNVVRDGETGLLSEYGDVEAFARSLEALLFSYSDWKRMSESSKVFAKEYSWPSIASSICHIYQQFYELRS
jgi:glycosyltransferase involved in cell wall biosynthesis